MNRRFISGTLAGVGALAIILGDLNSACAQGSIVYHGPVDVLLISSGANKYTYGVDMNSDGTEDFVFEAYTGFEIYSMTGGQSIGVPLGGIDLGNWSIPLLDGFSIGPVLEDPLQWTGSQQGMFNWIGATLHSRNTSGSAGYWNPPLGTLLTAYVGTEFTLNDGVHYGWIRVTVADIANGGTIHDWAYNSVPGEPILAGQVPEPSTWTLIAGGALCMVFHRSRRPS